MDIARSSLKLFIARVGASGLGFLGLTYFARELGAGTMGAFFLFQALLGILAIPADFGLRGAVEKRISEGESAGAYLASAIVLKTIPLTVIILGIIAFQGYINRYIGAPIAIYLAAGIVLQEAAKLSVVVLKGELRVGETAVLQLTRQVAWVGIGGLLITYGFEAKALVFSLLTGLGIVMFWGGHKTSVSLATPSVTHARSLVNYGKYNVVSSTGGYFFNWMDVAILGVFLTQVHVGAYETAWRVTSITILLSTSLATTLFPQISRWDAENAKERIEGVIRESITPALLLVVPAFFGTLVFSREILGLVFGPEFTIASTVLIILAGERILQSIHVILGRALQGINRPDLAAKATVVSIALNLSLNVILILSIGLVGAAIATAVSFLVNTLLHSYYLSKFVEIDIPYSEVSWCVISAAIMAISLFGIRSVVAFDSLSRLILGIGLGAVIYFVLVISSGSIRTKVFSTVSGVK